MKIATYNIQNIFHRDKSLVSPPIEKCVLKWINEMDYLMRKSVKSTNDFDRIKELSFLIGFESSKHEPYAVVRKRGGEFFIKGCGISIESKASSISEWNGWIPLQTVPVEMDSIKNKARVIAEVNADILLLQEVEDRSSLFDFNQAYLPNYNMVPYSEINVLQGNDGRGQELGLLTKNGFKIQQLKSFMEERTGQGNLIFDKNLIQYEIKTPSGNIFWLLAVHFIQNGKDKEASDNSRFIQAFKVAEVYQKMRKEGMENLIVLGTFNAVSYCYSLSPLLQNTDLKDISKHPGFNVDIDTGKDASYYRMGAYRMGVNIKQKDYLLLSPEMFKRVKAGGLNRRAVWPDKPGKWSVYNLLNQKDQEASEHPVVWGDLDI